MTNNWRFIIPFYCNIYRCFIYISKLWTYSKVF
nr:MAG TPA: hypothetical protein [Bacteriophage sp.]